jgi:signal transduction histidine kinase
MLAGINGIKLHARVPKNSKHVFIDQNLFRRLIDNLLSNALKFSPEGTTITLQLTYLPGANQPEPDQPSMRIRVADQGPGVAAEDRERIFQKYETGKVEGNKKVNQIGLGLAFCKMVTDAHIGQIFVTENQPQGAVFVVEV